MLLLRGIAVSLTSFVLLYVVLAVLVVVGWRWMTFARRFSAKRRANWLFRARIFPLLAAACFTLALVVPSFILHEPRSINESISLPLALGAGCLLLFVLGAFRVVSAHRRASRVVAGWLKEAKTLDAGVAAPTFQALRGTPPLTLVGVCSPRVLVSESTVSLLSSKELRVAVLHELAHMRSNDNLKKFVFYCSPFPGMKGLENAWKAAAELAADDGATSSSREALDLASALIKLSRLIAVTESPAFTMTLVEGSGSVSERVQRLLTWDETQGEGVSTRRGYAVLSALAAFLSAAAFYGPILAETHRITEFLVR